MTLKGGMKEEYNGKKKGREFVRIYLSSLKRGRE